MSRWSVRTGRTGPGRAMRLAAGLLTALLLAGCAFDADRLPPTAPLPPAAPRLTGIDRAASREHHQLVAALGGEYRHARAEQLLQQVVARLTPASDLPAEHYRVTILNSPTVNAFALPTGHVYVTRGLLALANDTSEIAGVLAHEIAHVTARHAVARAEMEQRSMLVSRVVAEVLNDPVAGEIVRDQTRLSIAGFSRAQELEADRIGVRTIAKAGYDPYGAARFLVSLSRNAELNGGASRTAPGENFLSTHPTTPERVSQAIAAARLVSNGRPGVADRDTYLNAINGIAYGEDPADGVVQGRRFQHPRLGITFAGPEGFQLDNTAQAVFGVSPDGSQALRLDAVELPPSQSLKDFLASGWIEGMTTQDITETTVNGLPAATGVTHGKEWHFQLAAIRVDGAVYRLVYASRDSSSAAIRNFRQTLASFRRLSSHEIASIRPRRIALVTAQPGDTAEKLASRMSAPDRPLERFLVLNGLTAGKPLTPGWTYKIITED